MFDFYQIKRMGEGFSCSQFLQLFHVNLKILLQKLSSGNVSGQANSVGRVKDKLKEKTKILFGRINAKTRTNVCGCSVTNSLRFMKNPSKYFWLKVAEIGFHQQHFIMS